MLSFDFLVIGSGIGGLGFALKVASYGSVAVVCKAKAEITNTCLAQGGLSAVTDPADSAEQHIADTLEAGAGLCNAEMVRLLAAEAPACIQELRDLGVSFTKATDGRLDLGREGGHTRNRIVHTHDHTGLSIQEALLKTARQHQAITILENHFAIDLQLEETADGKKYCTGARILNKPENLVFRISAKAIMLASGGTGQVYAHTTNPKVATGDGIAMAARAGAQIQDMEFIQFHPTALYDPGKPTFLISEAVRGFGAELKRPDGTAFAKEYHLMGSLAPRDIVARAIHSEMQQAGSPFVYLDMTHLPANEITERFPKIYARCLESNLDLTTDMIPVVPAAHYLCGGIVTDEHGRTSINGLYACGETTCTGIHGANRLASNSLPEAWIFAGRAAKHAIGLRNLKKPAGKPLRLPEINYATHQASDEFILQLKQNVRKLMWRNAGIVRNEIGLENCRQKLKNYDAEIALLFQKAALTENLLELRNLIQVAQLIIEAALKRKESLGCHFMGQIKAPSDKALQPEAIGL